jgi:hypothetical protein
MIAVTTDVRKARDMLTQIVQAQIPFALSKATNAVATDVQVAVRANLPGRFILRRKAFIERTVKILKFSNKRDRPIAAIVGIDPRFNFLAKFEQGGTKQAVGGGSLAIPVAARPTPQSLVAKSLGIRALQLRKHVTKSGAIQLKGLLRSFTIKTATAALVMQRVGKRGETRVLHVFKRSVPIRPLLGFLHTAERVVGAMWVRRASEALRDAVKNAR